MQSAVRSLHSARYLRETGHMERILGLYHYAVRANRRLNVFTPKISEFAFILGAMKSGTSTLWSYLIQHPSICKCLFKEPNFWTYSADQPNLDNYYRLWLPNPLKRQIALEASPHYTGAPYNPNVADRLRELPGRKHFLYLVRNPVDRVESHIAHMIARGSLSLDEASNLEDFARYAATSKYHSQLSNYRASFPDHPIAILSFDDLKRDPAELLKRACTALEINPAYRFRYIPAKNPRKHANGASRFKLTESQEAIVRDLLKNDMKRFEQEFGFPVAGWGFS